MEQKEGAHGVHGENKGKPSNVVGKAKGKWKCHVDKRKRDKIQISHGNC